MGVLGEKRKGVGRIERVEVGRGGDKRAWLGHHRDLEGRQRRVGDKTKAERR